MRQLWGILFCALLLAGCSDGAVNDVQPGVEAPERVVDLVPIAHFTEQALQEHQPEDAEFVEQTIAWRSSVEQPDRFLVTYVWESAAGREQYQYDVSVDADGQCRINAEGRSVSRDFLSEP